MSNMWHEIEWDEKKYFSNTTSTSYGNPVHAMYITGNDGRPRPEYLTSEGKKHFGY